MQEKKVLLLIRKYALLVSLLNMVLRMMHLTNIFALPSHLLLVMSNSFVGISSRYSGNNYLRSPNAEDIEKLLQVAESCGFLIMLVSLDCIHWEWKNCPAAHVGAYHGCNKKCMIKLDAVASYDTWL